MSTTRLPPLNALRAFEAVARHRSFRKAAEELFVTPAAITHQIKALEEQLGVVLFQRLNRRIELTPAALAALPRFRDAFEALAQGVAQLRDHGKKPRLTVRSTPTFVSRWMMPRLHRFLSAHPDTDVRLLASGQLISPLAQQLLTEEVGESAPEPDIHIQFSNGRPEGDVVDLLFAVEVVPMGHPRLLRGAHPLREPDDLRHHTLLHGDGALSDRSRSAWARWLAHAGATQVDPERGLQFDHSTLALEAAADGLGVTLAMPLLAEAELKRGDVEVAFTIALPLDKAYYAVTTSAALARPEVAAFRQWLLTEAAAGTSTGEEPAKKRAAKQRGPKDPMRDLEETVRN